MFENLIFFVIKIVPNGRLSKAMCCWAEGCVEKKRRIWGAVKVWGKYRLIAPEGYQSTIFRPNVIYLGFQGQLEDMEAKRKGN